MPKKRKSKRVKVPRASLAVTMLDDPDCIALVQDAEGREAFALFCLLIVAAKVQNNGGKFRQPVPVLAAMSRLPVEAFKAGLATLASRTDWIIADANVVAIRTYKKWNAWGGSRDGAGRRPENDDDLNESSGNQDARKGNSKSSPLPAVSVTGTSTGSGEIQLPAGPDADLRFTLAYARQHCSLELPAGKTGDLLNELGMEPLVEVLEHLAARSPATRWRGAKNPPGVFFKLVAKVCDGVRLSRDCEHEIFEDWRSRQESELAAAGRGAA